MNEHIQALDEVLKLAKAAQWVSDTGVWVTYHRDGKQVDHAGVEETCCWQCEGGKGMVHGKTWLEAIERYREKWTR